MSLAKDGQANELTKPFSIRIRNLCVSHFQHELLSKLGLSVGQNVSV